MSEVKLVRLKSGEELIGKCTINENGTTHIDKPVILVPTGEGSVGLMPYSLILMLLLVVLMFQKILFCLFLVFTKNCSTITTASLVRDLLFRRMVLLVTVSWMLLVLNSLTDKD
jgi:hypothetical protein